ncbi:flagellar biosynthesis anti-sigma factor FlgM [bacterium]|nr:flagellar biosynthesis anti-sigma factor FlgM [bacterium]
MAINLKRISNLTAVGALKHLSSGSETKSPQTQNSVGKKSDSVSLTDWVSTIHRAERSLASVPVVDARRVSEIARSVQDNGYEIDTITVADKIIELETKLSGKL